jgi:transposase-like protein
MIEKASGYRTRLAEIRQRGGKRWRTPIALREEITAWGRGLQSSGYAVSWIAREIGLSESALRRWLDSGREETGFRPVRLGSSRKVNRPEKLSLVSPGGYRLEGLSLSDAIDVFRQL